MYSKQGKVGKVVSIPGQKNVRIAVAHAGLPLQPATVQIAACRCQTVDLREGFGQAQSVQVGPGPVYCNRSIATRRIPTVHSRYIVVYR